jgi:hypothetical protein
MQPATGSRSVNQQRPMAAATATAFLELFRRHFAEFPQKTIFFHGKGYGNKEEPPRGSKCRSIAQATERHNPLLYPVCLGACGEGGELVD